MINNIWISFFGQPDVKEGDNVVIEYIIKKVGKNLYKNGRSITKAEVIMEQQKSLEEANEQFNIVPVGALEQEKSILKKRFKDEQVYGRIFYGIFLESIRCAQMDGIKESYEKAVEDYLLINLKLFNKLYTKE